MLLMVAGFSISSRAQATQAICSGSPVPPGWVVININTDFTQCSGTSNDIEIIEQISTLGPGATVGACSGQTLPSGWVLQDLATDFTRCFENSNDLSILLNLNGLALGTQESVCAGDALPTGWVVISISTDFTRCFQNTNDIETIVLVGDFSLSVSPGSQTVLRGATTSFNISVTSRSAGFTGAISLSTSGLPSDANPVFSPNPVPGTSSTLTVTGSANVSTFHPSIIGSSGNVSHSLPVTLTVTDFSLSLNPSSLTVTQGGSSAQGQVIINPINGFSGAVQFGAVNAPNGVSISFSPNPATTFSTMTVTANGSGPLGAFTPTIQGTNAGQTRAVNLALTVAGFTLSSCNQFVVPITGSASCQITINPTGGYSGSVSMSASGLPSGVSASFAPNPASASSTMTVTAAASSVSGTTPVTITGTDGNGVSKTAAVTLIVGTPPVPSRYVPVTPCRVADTRNPNGPFGGPFLTGGVIREFDIPNSACGIPSTAVAYALNATAVPRGALGYLTMFPCGQTQPLTSNLNSLDGRIKAVAAIVAAGTNSGVCTYPSNDTDLILDISGYFVPTANPAGLAFYPMTPCRIADTRNPQGPFGGPSLAGGTTRTFPILSSSCNIPSTAHAYSLNYTAIPKGALGYLTTWPAGQTQPLVSTLNAPTGTVTANAAIVAGGTNGDVAVFVNNNSDLVIDINGYFAPPGSGGLSLIPVTPCRILDTRNSPGSALELAPQGPATSAPFSGTLAVNVSGSSCGIPASAQAYVLNATVIPQTTLGYLTMWPNGTSQPLTSTLNALDGSIMSNMAIVSTNNGSINVFAPNPTQLVLDIYAYLAP
jgi:hypothetical protein